MLSASRCLDARGRCGDGVEALEGIVAVFTEGDDLPDLREGRGLLRAWRS